MVQYGALYQLAGRAKAKMKARLQYEEGSTELGERIPSNEAI